MNCTEARRQLPGPDGEPSALVMTHLQECAPCRMEAESLLEIDRRLERMGAYQLLALPALMVQLDREAEALAAPEGGPEDKVAGRRRGRGRTLARATSPGTARLWWAAAGAVLLTLLLLLLLLHR